MRFINVTIIFFAISFGITAISTAVDFFSPGRDTNPFLLMIVFVISVFLSIGLSIKMEEARKFAIVIYIIAAFFQVLALVVLSVSDTAWQLILENIAWLALYIGAIIFFTSDKVSSLFTVGGKI